jgi:DNA polymerase-3 subunit delta'
MLEDFKDGQPIAYKLLTNLAKKEKFSHAYLFQTGGFSRGEELAKDFAKTLFCPHSYTRKEKCEDCIICDLIDSGNLPEFNIINPDGLWIKKQQLIELQEEFSKKAITTSKKIYIINEADKLNAAASNSILKFLEEPEENIIAILLAKDINKVMKTIVSRCQVIFLKPDKLDIETNLSNDKATLLKIGMITGKNGIELENYINDEKNIDKLDKAITFIIKYEQNKIDALLDTKDLWHDWFKEKNDIIMAFETMILFYKDVLNYLYKKDIEVFCFYIDNIKIVANLNDEKDIIRKLDKIIIAKEKIKNNINTNLLIDKLIISMEMR